MPQAILDTLAAGVALDLTTDADTFSLPFTVERVSHLDFSPEILGSDTHLYVYGADERREIQTQVRTEREWDIHIGIVQRLAGDGNAEIDPLRLLVEQVGDYWEFRRPTGGANLAWVGMEVIPYIPELVKELTFVGVVQLTYRGVKA